jgi:putative PIN family toxin of toxin-antitoxin system
VGRPRVIFDTNVFLRALINPKGVNARLVQSLDRFILVVSPAIIEEVAEVLSRPELLGVKGIRKLDADRLVELLRKAPVVFPTETVTVCRDPDDDKFLEAALAAKAEYLVTGDKDLRDIGEYACVKIRFPAEFLRELGGEALAGPSAR